MRKKLFYTLYCAALSGVIIACTGMRERTGPVEVRIANQSSQDFEQVAVTFPSGKVDFGRVEKGKTTEYRPVGKAYRYAQVEVMANGRKLSLQPQDYMGEKPLDPGRYTYALNLDKSSGDLRLELIEDQG